MADEDPITQLIADDDARSVMYDDLVDTFGKEAVDNTLQEAVVKQLTSMYDNREQLERQAQAQPN
jgi:hypothetical protein